MKAIQLDAKVEHGKLIADIPADIKEGEHRILLILDGLNGLDAAQIHTLKQALQNWTGAKVLMPRESNHSINDHVFPVDNYGPWPTEISLHREDLYD